QSNSEKIIEIGTRIETEINSELKSEIKSEIKSELKSESTTINDELVIPNKEILSEDKQNLQILIDKLCTYFSSFKKSDKDIIELGYVDTMKAIRQIIIASGNNSINNINIFNFLKEHFPDIKKFKRKTRKY